MSEVNCVLFATFCRAYDSIRKNDLQDDLYKIFYQYGYVEKIKIS